MTWTAILSKIPMSWKSSNKSIAKWTFASLTLAGGTKKLLNKKKKQIRIFVDHLAIIIFNRLKVLILARGSGLLSLVSCDDLSNLMGRYQQWLNPFPSIYSHVKNEFVILDVRIRHLGRIRLFKVVICALIKVWLCVVESFVQIRERAKPGRGHVVAKYERIVWDKQQHGRMSGRRWRGLMVRLHC